MANMQDLENKRNAAKAAKAEEMLSEDEEQLIVPEEQGKNMLEGFLKAANYKKDNNLTREYKVIRNGEHLFSFHVRPISDKELRDAKKAATRFGKNPMGKNYPPIEISFDATLGNSYLIYFATTDEDKRDIWDNKQLQQAVAQQNNVSVDMGVELIDQVLTNGDKEAVIDLIDELMGNEEDVDVDPEDYAKNS